MRPVAGRTLLAYGAAFYLALLIPDLAIRWVLNEWLPSWSDFSGWRVQPTFDGKLVWYADNAASYDLVFVGDSRTYCGIAPDVIDPLLGTHSFNLAMFGNWFPTQYPSLQQILRDAPSGTVFVWSVGHQNFQKVHGAEAGRIHEEIGNLVAIGWRNVPRYLDWGFPLSSLVPNLVDHFPGLKVYSRRAFASEHLRGFLRTPVSRAERGKARVGSHTSRWESSPLSEPARDVLRELRSRADVLGVEIVRSDGVVTSFEVFKRGGNYVRIELVPEFFRGKQRERAASLERVTGSFVADPEYWQNFLAILDLFAAHPVRLIVNEIEEAPYHYRGAGRRRYYAQFMQQVRREVERRGVPYVRAELERLSDEHYFDYNHLNSVGIPIYSALLADALRAPMTRLGVQ